MITLAIAGKPNCGKSTFFRAATLAHAEIANYPFTTIDPNKGVAYVRTPCSCRKFGLNCGHCNDGVRFIPINLIDVAGLVPDAHKGKGLGNQFLDNLRQAHAIIHIIDASGSTDIEGNPVEPGSHDPHTDIDALIYEMSMWLYGILEKHWSKLLRQATSKTSNLIKLIAETLAGLGITEPDIIRAMNETGFDIHKSDDKSLILLSCALFRNAKPMLTVGNKIDSMQKEKVLILEKEGIHIASAAAELALRNADAAKIISYIPGNSEFAIINPDSLNSAQKSGLAGISTLLKTYGSTGVQSALNNIVFSLLDMIVVYPVEDETHLTDGKGRILPDAFLMRKGSNPKEMAFQVHSDIGNGFLYAIDAHTKMRVKESHELSTGDVIRIVSTAK